MATLESVKAKIQGLINKANAATSRADTQLSPAVDALIAGYGSGGGGFVDVTELPDISEAEADVVYRLLQKVEASVGIYVAVYDGAQTTVMSLEDMFAAEGATINTKIYVVSELPEVMEPIDEATLTIPFYVIESTGIAYLSLDGTNAAVATAGEMFESPDGNGGWIESTENIPQDKLQLGMNFFCMRSEGKTEVKGLYLVLDGKWQLFKETIDVEELPVSGIKKNAIYRVGTYVEQDLYSVLAGGEIKPFVDHVKEIYGDNANLSKVEFIDTLSTPSEVGTVYVHTVSGRLYIDSDGTLAPYDTTDPLFVLLLGQYYGLCDAEAVDLSKAGLYAVREGIIVDKYCVRSGGGWREFKIKSIFQEYVNGDLTELKPEDLSGIYRISDYALANCKTLEKVTFFPSNGVIGNSAFEGCENLKEVVFHDTVLGIGNRAFYGCKSITEIDWYSLRNLWDLGQEAFANCTSLKHAAPTADDNGGGYIFNANCSGLFAGCTALETAIIDFKPDAGWLGCSGMFSRCTSLHTFTDNVYMDCMPVGMFAGCSSLKDIYVPTTKVNWSYWEKGEKWDQGTPDYVIHCTDGDILKSDPESGSDDRPDEPVLDGAAIARSIVDGTITEYSDSEATEVRQYAFQGCSALQRVSAPKVGKVGINAFNYCGKLQSVEFPVAAHIGSNAFEGCYGMTSISLPKATGLDSYAFYKCSALKSVNLPKVQGIGTWSFQNCTSLSSIDLPEATSAGSGSFYGCGGLMSVNLPEITRVDSNTFRSCVYLTNVNIPKATKIDTTAFSSCERLLTMDLPTATNIYAGAFEACKSLTRLILRTSSVCNLRNSSAFNSCYHIHGTVDATYNPNGDKDGYFYVPRALVDSYKSATNWSTFATQFRALEDYTVDGTTTGSLDENKI